MKPKIESCFQKVRLQSLEKQILLLPGRVDLCWSLNQCLGGALMIQVLETSKTGHYSRKIIIQSGFFFFKRSVYASGLLPLNIMYPFKFTSILVHRDANLVCGWAMHITLHVSITHSPKNISVYVCV